MKHAQVQWETETGERSEKMGSRRKKGRRLIRRIPGRSGSAFYFCSVIKKWINERETRGPMLSQLTSWGKVCCSVAAWEGARSSHSITLAGFFCMRLALFITPNFQRSPCFHSSMKSFPSPSPEYVDWWEVGQHAKFIIMLFNKAKSAHSIERHKYMKIMAFLNVSSAERSQLYLLFSNYYLPYCI